MNDFTFNLTKRIGLDRFETAYFETLSEKYRDNTAFNSMINRFAEQPDSAGDICDELKELAAVVGDNEYSLTFLLLLLCAERLFDKYKLLGIDEEIFYDSMCDLKYKLDECKSVLGIYGNRSLCWTAGFFKGERFKLGRLQYNTFGFLLDKYTDAEKGITLKKDDTVITIHIPSSPEPFDKAARYESYKKAYDFFSDYRINGYLPIVCNSWLLFPHHHEFLRCSKNIIGFMDDFDHLELSSYAEGFPNCWRVFNCDYDGDISKLPTRTSMQRAYADWLAKGNKTGNGYGVMLYKPE